MTRRPRLRPSIVHVLRNAFALFLLFSAAPPAELHAQIAGQNVNMVSGTGWPGGDPFLQRQNEPSMAVSSRNLLHLLAGANDYRTVDLPIEAGSVPGTLSGDAWLGVFKSFDGGQSWQSTLLPGYPQDQSAAGMVSPLKAYEAAADPTVRPGANGLIYYSGIAFNRGTNVSAVFFSRFFDQNAKENGDATQFRDTIAYLDTKLIDTVTRAAGGDEHDDDETPGQFLDKPWIAVDVPRSGSGATACSFTPPGGTAQSFVGGNVYATWSDFTGSQLSKIMFSRSLNCGKTWSTPIKLSEGFLVNQGTNIAVDPRSGAVYVAWRVFATSSQPDAILVAKSTDFGQTFSRKNTVQVAAIKPLDQGTTGTRFRTNVLPSIAVSVDGGNVSRVHVAWAQRNTTNSDAQIVVATSADGLKWSAPVGVDTAPLRDDATGTFARGHQFMPQLTFSQGRLMAIYYDQRFDHTLALLAPNQPFAPSPDAKGSFYKVFRDLRLEPSGAAPVFGLTLDDLGLQLRRHTVDLRVAEAIPGATLSFSSASVSQYKVGLRADLKDEGGNPIPLPVSSLNQLQANTPNLPLFAQGTVPFLGDYIDIAGPTIVADGAGGWKFNTAPSPAPVFFAAWTDNRDVVPPKDGNWANYTPVGGGGTSVLDPTKTSPPCSTGQEGMRNQNIYSSRITEGLLVGSPQNVKPLFAAPRARAFIVTLQNLTSQDRTFTMTLAPGPGVSASFQQTAPTSVLSVTVAAHSGAARPVFASSSNPAGSVTVNVAESGPGSIGLAGFVILNPEASVSPLAQPDGTTVDIGTVEIYTPSLSLWNQGNTNPFLNISNPNQVLNISNLNISNPDPAILNISNLNISNLNISNLNISNPDPAVLNISNLNISNTTAANLNISNLNISNLNISNTTVSDTTYAVTNSGNTTHSYRVVLFGSNTTSAPLQLIVTKNYASPASVGCTLQNVPQGSVLANVNNAVIASTLAEATDPDLTDGATTNATMALAPGETAFVTLRGALTTDQMAQLTRGLTPVVVAHGKNTDGTNDFAALLSVQTTSASLAAAAVGVPYNDSGFQFQAVGGSGTITWTFTGTLPTGLTLSPSGLLSGTPSEAGTFTFSVTASDGSPTPQTSTQSLSISVAARTTSTTLTPAKNPIVVGEVVSVTVTVTDTQPGGAAPSPTGTVTLSGDPGLSATTCVLVSSAPGVSTCSVTVTPATPGPRTISASYPGTSVHLASGGSAGLTVNPAATATSVTSSLNPSIYGQAVTLTATVSATPPGAGSPTGTVTFLDGATSLGTGTLNAAGVASFSTSSLSVATHSITASYGGDTSFNVSTSPVLSQVVNKVATTTGVTSSPSPSTYGQSVIFTATVTGPGGTPTGTVTFLDGAVSLGTGPLDAAGVAAFSTSSLLVATHSITASYGGDTSFNFSTSPVLSQVVNRAATATVVTSSLNPSTYGQSVTFTATVTGPGGTPTGTVTFLDGGYSLGTGTLNASGVAKFSTVKLAAGSHSITASYSGNVNYAGSSSGAVIQVVRARYDH